MSITRRKFIRSAGLTLGFTVAGKKMMLTPALAYEQALPYSVLRAPEVATLEALAEILLPGATRAGVAHFVDAQLQVAANDSLLMLKYFNYPPPYASFYQSALQEISRFCQDEYASAVADLSDANGRRLVKALRDNSAADWHGPPAPLVYHALRNDAVDVVYGTVAGFEKLGIPYMAHILPPEGWTHGTT